MNWEVIFRPESLAMYGEGILTTLWLLGSSLLVGGVLAILFALALTGPWVWLQRLVGAYTYSDMTGFALSNVGTPSG